MEKLLIPSYVRGTVPSPRLLAEYKKYSDRVAKAYAAFGDDDTAAKIALCHRDILMVNCDCGACQFTGSSFRCNKRLCVPCALRRGYLSSCRFAEMVALLEKSGKLPGGIAQVTYTVESVRASQLREAITSLKKAEIAMKKSLAYAPCQGSLVQVEVTAAKGGNLFHPHVHCLLLLNNTPSPPQQKEASYLLAQKWKNRVGDNRANVKLQYLTGDRGRTTARVATDVQRYYGKYSYFPDMEGEESEFADSVWGLHEGLAGVQMRKHTGIVQEGFSLLKKAKEELDEQDSTSAVSDSEIDKDFSEARQCPKCQSQQTITHYQLVDGGYKQGRTHAAKN